MQRITIWDLPTRIFHWSLVALVCAAVISAQVGGNAMQWHGRFGAGVLGLLGFRLAWGLFGATYARFVTFVRGPSQIVAYLRGQWHGVGHNPLGALSVLAMLAALGVQALTGLFGDDDIAFRGPYAILVSSDAVTQLTGLHKLNAWILGCLVIAHLSAIAFYARVKKDNLIKPMLVGHKDVPAGTAESAKGGGILVLIIAVLLGSACFWIANGGLAPMLTPPPAAASAPSW